MISEGGSGKGFALKDLLASIAQQRECDSGSCRRNNRWCDGDDDGSASLSAQVWRLTSLVGDKKVYRSPWV
jgi:hypothetical protein